MARFTDNPDFIEESKKSNRKINVRVSIDWFDDGEFEEIESASDEFLKLNLDRTLEGDVGTSIMDKGTLVLDNSNNDYSPKSIASRFNKEIGDDDYEFNLIPNRTVLVELSVNDSDYYLYYMGIISSIESDYDNRTVSIDIEDEMITLQNEEPRDQMFFERPVKEVIETLLEDSAIDYNEDLIDDIPYIITYNFKEEDTIYSALRKIAEMSWAKFYVVDGELYFVDIQELDEPNLNVVEDILDEDFLNEGYTEEYSTTNLYSKATVTADPYKRTEEQMIWTGTETQTSVSEDYQGEDIDSNDQLQLTRTNDEGETKDTNNTPIVEGSVAVEFGTSTYTVGSGLDSVNYLEGTITFTNDSEYPLPDDEQKVTVNYQFYLLTLAPAKDGEPYTKEIIAKFDHPSTDIKEDLDYIKYEAVTGSSEVETNNYTERFNNITRKDSGGSGTEVEWSNTITLHEDATNIRISGKFDHNAYSDRFLGMGGKRKSTNSKIELYVNGDLHSEIYQTKKFGWSNFDSKTIASGVSGGDEIQLKLSQTRNCDKDSAMRLRNCIVSINTLSVEQESGEVGKVDAYLVNLTEDRVKIVFENYSDTEVSIYSIYKGEEEDNIYILGVPYKQNSPIERIVEDNDALSSFSSSGSEISIDNNLIYDGNRASRTANFLIDYYSTPRSLINISIKGKPHFELLDKVHVVRDEADIDNDFLINQISDNFNEEGEWNQELELRQARSSKFQYTGDGEASIVDRPSIEDSSRNRPPRVSNLQLSLDSIKAGETNYPAIKVEWDSNRLTRYHKIYIKRDTDLNWELVNRVEESEYIIESVYNKGEYDIKVVSEGYNGLNSDFSDSPVETINYIGSEIFSNSDITLTELEKRVQKGLFLPIIEVDIDASLDDYLDTIKIYTKYEDDNEWKLSATTSELTYEVLTPQLGTYELKIIPTDKHGNSPNFSDVDPISFEVTGNTDLPSKIELDNVYWGADYIEFSWKPHPDEDFDQFEIRLDDNFGDDN